MSVGIFIPLYNAEGILAKSIPFLVKEVEKLKLSYHLYLVDDASTDNTPSISKKIAHSNRKITYIRYDNGPSRRENLFCSMGKAQEPFLIFMDADFATDAKDLKKLIEALRSGSKIVIGDRYLPGSSLRRPLKRLIISKVYNLAIGMAFGSRIKDHQCGFKGFSRDAFLRLYRLLGYDKSFRRGWFMDAELLLFAQMMEIPLEEIEVSLREDKRSTFNIRREMRMLPYVLFTLPQKLRRLRQLKSSDHAF